MLLNKRGFDAIENFLVMHPWVFCERPPPTQNMHAWARAAEDGQGLVEIRAADSLSGYTVDFALGFDDGRACE